jgi:hypothetical protein
MVIVKLIAAPITAESKTNLIDVMGYDQDMPIKQNNQT